MSTILLAGGAGYIGSHTAVALLDGGYDVIIADSLDGGSAAVVERIGRITGVTPCFAKADLSDPKAVSGIFRENKVDAVIHFAGFKAVGESVADPLKYYRNNLNTTITLLDVMEKHGVRIMIFSSSATVYRPYSAGPIAESFPLGASNPYGWTKMMSERIISDLCAAKPEFSAVLLRYFNPIGAHESGLIGELSGTAPNNLLPYIARVALGQQEHLNIFGNDYPTRDGTGVRDYIHVCDLAAGHVAALGYAQANEGVQVFNLGTGRGYSVLEIVRAFESASGVRIPCVFAPRRPGDLDSYYADPAKAEKLLGWRAESGLEKMCADTWRWIKNNPDGYVLGVQ